MGKVELHLEIDAELVALAEKKGVVLDAALEEGIRSALAREETQPPIGIVEAAAYQRSHPEEAEARARQWAEENAEAIRVHNQRIAERGVFGEDLRRW